MGLIKSLGFLVLLLAVSLGTIGKVQPELFLKLPGPFGFLLYMILGGKHLPPYFDPAPFSNFNEWLNDGDVVVATGAKTGTTWICYCSDAIRRKGSDTVGLPFRDVSLTTPWFEFTTRPGQTWKERQELFNSTVLADGTRLKDYWDNKAFPFRVFKSHMLPEGSGEDAYTSVLPVREATKVKFISAMRKPDEYIKSIFNFFPSHTKEFPKMWGGFPPLYDDLNAVLKDHLPGQPLEALYLSYNKAWWKYRNDPNVLLMHYSDMVKDLDGMITKLSSFLGVELSSTEFANVKEKCGYKHMKDNANLFNYELLFGGAEISGTPNIMQSGKHLAKDAHSKDKAATLSAESQKLWDETLEKELDPALLKFLQEGGELPQ